MVHCCQPDSACVQGGQSRIRYIYNRSLVHYCCRWPGKVVIGLRADGSTQRRAAYAIVDRILHKHPKATHYLDGSADSVEVSIPV